LDEMIGFLEDAKQCVEGTTEAIEAAIYRDAHPVSNSVIHILIVWRLL
jgi:hypothetical protein